MAIGLSDIDEHAAQLRAGIAIIDAAIEGKIKMPSRGRSGKIQRREMGCPIPITSRKIMLVAQVARSADELL
jgi:hypothetical protein